MTANSDESRTPHSSCHAHGHTCAIGALAAEQQAEEAEAISQAILVLMARFDCSSDEAATRLVVAAGGESTTVAAVAADIVFRAGQSCRND